MASVGLGESMSIDESEPLWLIIGELIECAAMLADIERKMQIVELGRAEMSRNRRQGCCTDVIERCNEPHRPITLLEQR